MQIPTIRSFLLWSGVSVPTNFVLGAGSIVGSFSYIELTTSQAQLSIFYLRQSDFLICVKFWLPIIFRSVFCGTELSSRYIVQPSDQWARLYVWQLLSLDHFAYLTHASGLHCCILAKVQAYSSKAFSTGKNFTVGIPAIYKL